MTDALFVVVKELFSWKRRLDGYLRGITVVCHDVPVHETRQIV